jgi:hypothetical protein
VFDSTGAAAFAIAVDRIDTDVVCTAPESTPAVRGHLIALHLRVTTGADLSVLGDAPAIRAIDFRTLAAGGSLAEAATPGAGSCLPDAESFPAGALTAGQELVGTLVLDVAAPTGTVVFTPAHLTVGAEWTYAPSEPAAG